MFEFVKQIFISAMFFSCNLPSVNSLKCISMNNQECKVGPEIVNVNSDEPVFYLFTIKTSKCRCECKELIDKGVCDKGSIWNLVTVSVDVINHAMLVSI